MSTSAPTLYEYDSFGHVTGQTLAPASPPTPQNSPIIEQVNSPESTEGDSEQTSASMNRCFASIYK